MVKRAILFINGDLASPPQVPLKKKDFLIGVDGGTRLARKLGLKPDLIIGDFDSLPCPSRPKSVFKQSQELTDTEFALDYCVKHGFKDIVLVGVLGSRLDHLLTNIFLGYRFNFTIIDRLSYNCFPSHQPSFRERNFSRENSRTYQQAKRQRFF